METTIIEQENQVEQPKQVKQPKQAENAIGAVLTPDRLIEKAENAIADILADLQSVLGKRVYFEVKPEGYNSLESRRLSDYGFCLKAWG